MIAHLLSQFHNNKIIGILKSFLEYITFEESPQAAWDSEGKYCTYIANLVLTNPQIVDKFKKEFDLNDSYFEIEKCLESIVWGNASEYETVELKFIHNSLLKYQLDEYITLKINVIIPFQYYFLNEEIKQKFIQEWYNQQISKECKVFEHDIQAFSDYMQRNFNINIKTIKTKEQ